MSIGLSKSVVLMVLRSIMVILAVLFTIVDTHGGGLFSNGIKSSGAGSRKQESKLTFQGNIKPLLSQYCYGCHGEKKKGDLDLSIYTDDKSAAKDQKVFERLLKNLQAHEM